jgi:hypothetical protein
MASLNSETLLAVALVINRSRDGPAFVFHYPSTVDPVNARAAEPEPQEVDDVLLERLSQPAGRDGPSTTDLHSLRGHDNHHPESGGPIIPWERVAGFPTRDLAGILTPARSYHKRLFQLSLDPLYCVSYPIHVPEDGRWKRPKKARKSKASKHGDDHPSATSEGDSKSAGDNAAGRDAEATKKDEGDEEKRSSMTMFNLVFMLNPRRNEAKEVVESLYANILKKVNKAYRYSQQHCDFIWKESKRILYVKDKAREERA